MVGCSRTVVREANVRHEVLVITPGEDSPEPARNNRIGTEAYCRHSSYKYSGQIQNSTPWDNAMG